jgi:hypothetical protein
LQQAVRTLAAVAPLARHWPAHGWHDATLALAGGLLRGGIPVDRCKKTIEAIWKTAGTHDDASDRDACVDSTAQKLKDGEQVVGWP